MTRNSQKGSVLFVIMGLTRGGAERVTVTLAEFMCTRAYQVAVATLEDGAPDFFQVPPDVDRVKLGQSTRAPKRPKLAVLFNSLLLLRRELRARRPDVVIGMMTVPGILAILASLGLGIRVVVAERNYPGLKPIHPLWGFLRARLYRLASAHVAQTQETANWLANNANARNIHIIPNSVTWPLPNNAPVVEPSKTLDRSTRIVLAVGTKSVQKGFDYLIEAFGEIAADFPAWDLVIVGWSPEDDRGSEPALPLHELAARAVPGKRIHFVGKAGNMGDWYERADLFVLSSRYEGFPNVLLEAGAAGLPVIAADCEAGPRDVITDGDNGLLIPSGSSKELASAMRKLMQDPDLRAALGMKATEMRVRFSEERVLAQWEALLEAELAQARGV